MAKPTSKQQVYNSGVALVFLADVTVIVMVSWGIDKVIGGVSQEDHDDYASWLRHLAIMAGFAFVNRILSKVRVAREKRKSRDKAERDVLFAVLNRLQGGTIGRPRPEWAARDEADRQERVRRNIEAHQNRASSKPVVIRADVTDLPRKDS